MSRDGENTTLNPKKPESSNDKIKIKKKKLKMNILKNILEHFEKKNYSS